MNCLGNVSNAETRQKIDKDFDLKLMAKGSAPSVLRLQLDFKAHVCPILHVNVINRIWKRVLIESPVDSGNTVSEYIRPVRLVLLNDITVLLSKFSQIAADEMPPIY